MGHKIAFLINSLTDGGAEKVVQLLADRLNSDGVDIEIICLEKNNKFNFKYNFKISYLSNFNGKESGLKKLLLVPILAYRLKQYVNDTNIDIVQSHLFRASYVNIISKLLFASKQNIQVVNHSVISRYLNSGLLGKVNLYLIRTLYPFANKIISVSNIVQNDMQKLFAFRNTLEVIHNPFDIKRIEEQSNERIDDFVFKEDKKYIISVGRLIELKRNRDMVLALSRLDKNVELIFIGEGDKKESLVKLSKELNINNRVHFIGWVDNPYKYIKKSDILVSTSQTESFGNTLVEAMVCKTVVISTKSGGPVEIIDDKINGILIDIGDIDGLENNINILLQNKQTKENYIKNGYKKAKKFDISNIIRQYKNILGVN